jgi:hypothetical protein
MLNMLPWESLFYTVGQIDGVPQTITVPETLILNAANVREACMGYLGEQRLTLKDMIKEVTANLKTLLTLERTFWIEYTFLTEHAQPLLLKKIRAMVVDQLPTQDGVAKMPKVPGGGIVQGVLVPNHGGVVTTNPYVTVLLGIEHVKRSPLCFAGGVEVEAEVSAVAGLVRGLMEQVAPSDEYLKTCSAFFKHCLMLMENFVSVTFDKTVGKKGIFPIIQTTTLVGRKALTYEFNKFKEEFEGGIHKTLKDVGIFRTFHWALAPEQKSLTTIWIRDLTQAYMGNVKAIADASAKVVGKAPLPSGGGPSASSASSSSALASPSLMLPSPTPLPHSLVLQETQLAVSARKPFSTTSKKSTSSAKDKDVGGVMKFFAGKVGRG